VYDIGCPRSIIPTHDATRSSVPLWFLVVSMHGVAFTMIDGTIYYILNLVEVNEIVHIIVVTLLHSVHLRYGSTSSSASPSACFVWPGSVHSPDRHTTTTTTDQVMTQIWPPMYSP
jgi:hypothetical protein